MKWCKICVASILFVTTIDYIASNQKEGNRHKGNGVVAEKVLYNERGKNHHYYPILSLGAFANLILF